MLNWLILYCFPMSFLLCFYHHRRLVITGEPCGLGAFARGSVRAWIIGFFMCMAFFREGLMNPLGAGYVSWWEDYTCEHSAILWFLGVIPVTLTLWVLKIATYYTMKEPSHYAVPKGLPEIKRTNMWTPIFWNTAFWAWLLMTPVLPFWSCWVQGFLIAKILS